MPSWADDLTGLVDFLRGTPQVGQTDVNPLSYSRNKSIAGVAPPVTLEDALAQSLGPIGWLGQATYGHGPLEELVRIFGLDRGGSQPGGGVTGIEPASGVPAAATTGPQPGAIPAVTGQQALTNMGVPAWQIPGLLAAANAYKVPPEILAGLERQESGFSMDSVGSSGEHGPFQFMPGTAEGFGLDWSRMQDPTYFAQQAAAAAQYLAGNFATWGNWTDALYAYNGGNSPVGVANSRKVNPNYAPNILRYATDARSGLPIANAPSPKDLPGGKGPAGQPFVTLDGVEITPGSKEAQAFSLAESVWKTVYGTDAPYYVVQAFIDANVQTVEQANNVLQAMPSPIDGMNLGDYTQFKKNTDTIFNKYVGRPVPESFLAQMAKEGRSTPALVDAWFWSNGINQIPKDAYQQIFDSATQFTKTWGTIPSPQQVQKVWNDVQSQGGYPSLPDAGASGTREAVSPS